MKYLVTVIVAGYADFTVEVEAPTQGKAQSKAMLKYPHPLRGQLVTYKVTFKNEWGTEVHV